ncbi:MAG: uL30 family ribosomal protein [Candidatus Micrarchaeia archaeon]
MPEEKEEAKAFLVIRIRGRMQTRATVEHALKQMHLTRKNHAVILPANTLAKGTLNKVKDYVAWGPANEETTRQLLENRMPKIAKHAKELSDGKTALAKINKAKPVIRLQPAKGGFGSIKQPKPKGVLGNQGENINKLALKMI